ncbi:sulfatase family protein [Mucilaginibacter boryungensis]|uniref:Arylsulfatase n=1 Tax=Mucilaginibacter boryungensis TaxID=768480 RepID=A0ABR9XJB9_9SPHI|nr:arylsulfatase [Mucilaginibacter boryungensis]MBE9667144.1 arylsulfatase [Mucilaginibacter boryungensis]
MKFKNNIVFAVCCLALPVFTVAQKATTRKPNIVFIYVDDLGYGDVGCYGAQQVKTPNVDRLAAGGVKFTDAHCSASTCTPSRFAILTGSYAFRNNAAILPGDAPLIVNPEQQTLPGLLKQAGYTTAVIGKWHLGLGTGHPNWNDSINPGPREVGFDYSFIIPATPDRVPTVFVEDHHVARLDRHDPIEVNYDRRIGNDPTGLDDDGQQLKMKADSQHSGTIVNGVSRIGYMKGGRNAYWKDEDFANVLTNKALHFIAANKRKPFFLYFATPNIHVPRMPNTRFVGATKMGARGDAIAEMDWITGQVLQQLKKLHLINNTLIIFSSDNGPVLDDGYADKAEALISGHLPAGPYKGGKYSAYEGGTRIPFITYWPGTIKPGVNKAMISQVDLFSSLAALTGAKIAVGAAPDSYNFLPSILGKSQQGRKTMIEEAFTMCYRQGDWKYIAPATKIPPAWLANKRGPTGLQSTPQLYNLKTDPGEQHNLAQIFLQKTKELAVALTRTVNKSY